MLLPRLASALVAGLLLAGCIIPPTSAQRLSEAAYDFNDAARFGRIDTVSEHIREIARDELSRKHAAWGKSVRIVDVELGRMSMRKDGDADVFVTINWQRDNETYMRTTEIAQRWTSSRGNWAVISEEVRTGDHGLLSEESEAEKPKADDAAPPPAPQSRYRTRVIYEQ